MVFGIPLLTLLLIIWAALTAVLILLLVYRGITAMHEDDQLFLSESEVQFQSEQAQLATRLQKISPYIRILSLCSAVLIVAIGALWLYKGLVSRG